MTDHTPLTDEELAELLVEHETACYECGSHGTVPRLIADLRASRAEVERLLTQDGDNEKLAETVAKWHKRAIDAEAEAERLRAENAQLEKWIPSGW